MRLRSAQNIIVCRLKIAVRTSAKGAASRDSADPPSRSAGAAAASPRRKPWTSSCSERKPDRAYCSCPDCWRCSSRSTDFSGDHSMLRVSGTVAGFMRIATAGCEPPLPGSHPSDPSGKVISAEHEVSSLIRLSASLGSPTDYGEDTTAAALHGALHRRRDDYRQLPNDR